MDISKSIRVGLAKIDKKQNWMASKMQVSNAYVSAVCRGEKVLSLNKVALVAEIFGVPVSEFIKWGE